VSVAIPTSVLLKEEITPPVSTVKVEQRQRITAFSSVKNKKLDAYMESLKISSVAISSGLIE